MAELKVSDTQILLKRPILLSKSHDPFWKERSFEPVVPRLLLEKGVKTYTTTALRRTSVVSFEVCEPIHTIKLYMEGSHTHEIQFEDEAAFLYGVEQLRNIFQGGA